MPFDIRLPVAAGLLAAAGLLVGCGGDTDADLVASGKALLAKDDFRGAAIQFKSALQKRPDSFEARLLLAKALLQQGDGRAAQVELTKAEAIEPKNPQLPPLQAQAMLLEGAYRKVVDTYANTSLPDAVAQADLKAVIAASWALLEQRAQAETAVQDALRAVPNHPASLLVSARIKAGANDLDGALQLVDTVIAAQPRNVEAWQLRGNLKFYGKGDSAGALESFRKVIELRRDAVPAYVGIITIHLLQQDIKAAKADFELLKKAHPKLLQTYYFEAQFAYLSQDYAKAREILQQLLRSAPESVQLLQLSGAVETQLGSLVQAQALFAKALQLQPERMGVRRQLAQVYLRSGEAAKALELFRPMIETGNVEDPEVLYLVAEAYLQRDDLQSAETFFTRAAKVAPGDPKIRTAVALTELAKGRVDVAFTQLQEIAASDKGAVADIAIVNARLRRNELDEALKAVEELQRKQPNRPLPPYLRGRIELARKDVTAARQSFERALSLTPSFFPAAAQLATLDLADNKPDAARGRFEAITKVDPRHMQALLAMADMRERSGGSVEDVASLIRQALRANPNEPAPRLRLIEHYLNHRDTTQALEVAREAVVALPRDPDLLDALGRGLLAAADFQQAISTFNKLTSLQPNSPRAFVRLASLYAARRDFDTASQNLRKALQIAPNLVLAQEGLVNLAMRSGKPEQAVAVARSVQQQRPTSPVGYLLEGDIHLLRKNWPAARAAYQLGLDKTTQESDLASKLHVVLLAEGRTAEADKQAASWLKAHPQDAGFLFHLASSALNKPDFPLAERLFQEVLKLRPDNAIALNNVAWLLVRQQKPGALAYAEKAVALMPGAGALRDTLALVLADGGDLPKAIAAQRKAVELAPTTRAYQLTLAKLLLKAGDRAEARTLLQALVKLGEALPEYDEAKQMLAALPA